MGVVVFRWGKIDRKSTEKTETQINCRAPFVCRDTQLKKVQAERSALALR